MTRATRWLGLTGFAAGVLLCGTASAQISGARGGLAAAGGDRPTRLRPEDAGSFIAVEGSVELRLQADGLRVVFAIVTEAATPSDCWERERARREEFLAALAAAGLTGESVQVDFISMLPVFSWKQETRDGQPVLIEQLAGHRLQENLHVAVADEEAGRRMIELALSKGVHDVVTVEYWSRATAAKRREAIEGALAAARSKADLLLAAFATRPLLANVVEQTEVLTPDELYRSFENVHAGDASSDWRGEVTRVSAVRPRNTFYAGFEGDVDVSVTTPRMRPEISVVSSVVLYFESPAHPRTPPAKEPERR